MKDWLKCQISPFVKYRQHQKNKQSMYSLQNAHIESHNNVN